MTTPSCPACPDDAYSVSVTDAVAVDFINGNPAEYGEFVANIADFGIDKGNSDDSELRELLGLPEAGGDIDGNVTLRFKCGSGILVDSSDPNYHIWKAYRLDCGCLKYDCGTGSEEPLDITCPIDEYRDSDGTLDFNSDKIITIPYLKLNETFGVGDGTRLDGSIPNLMFFDASIEHSLTTYNGIPPIGRFDNYTDPYGIIYSAQWTISGSTIDITTIIKDPRIPGQSTETGFVRRTGNSVRVFKHGLISTIRQVIRRDTTGYTILLQTERQEEGDFQATFGCDDTYSTDPFLYHVNTSALDQVEFDGGSDFVQDPVDSTEEFAWWPQVSFDENGNIVMFEFFDAGVEGPLS